MGIITRKSFTLIELVVAIGVLGLILPSLFSIFFTMVRQQIVLMSYQIVKQQGDSAQRNIKNILQNRTLYITDQTYTATDICPLPLTPTPTHSPDIYITDKDGRPIHLYQNTVSSVVTISSSSGLLKTYHLTSKDVTISNVEFTCYRVNEFSPVIVSTKFTVQKSTTFKNVFLPYSFNTRIMNY